MAGLALADANISVDPVGTLNAGEKFSISGTTTIDKVKKSPFFIGASPIIPAYLDAFINTSSVYTAALDKLRKNIALFINLNRDILSHFRFLPEYQVFYTEKDEIYEIDPGLSHVRGAQKPRYPRVGACGGVDFRQQVDG